MDRLGAALAPLVGTARRLDALPSGTTGRSYLVETASGRYVAKVFARQSGALLGPGEQFELMRLLAEARISPCPVGFDPDARLLVTRFVEHSMPLTREALRRPANIEKIVRCLRRLHGLTAEIPRFAPMSHAGRYVRRAGGLASLSGEDRKRYEELSELASTLEWPGVGVCHNDLLADNVLVDGGVKLIDFDYAVMAPPVVDLASLAVMNDLPESEASDLLDQYYGGRPPAAATEFAGIRRLVRLLAHFWALASGTDEAAIVAQYRISDD